MALALNAYKTVTAIATTSAVGIYTAPVGYAGVVLLANVANIGAQTNTVSFSHRRSRTGIAVTTEIQRNAPIDSNDSISLVRGKLVVEPGDVLLISGSNNTDLKVTLSILETLI